MKRTFLKTRFDAPLYAMPEHHSVPETRGAGAAYGAGAETDIVVKEDVYTISKARLFGSVAVLGIAGALAGRSFAKGDFASSDRKTNAILMTGVTAGVGLVGLMGSYDNPKMVVAGT